MLQVISYASFVLLSNFNSHLATVSKSPTLQTIFDRKLNKIDKAADVYIETPQKEIEQLQKYVVDVISEVTELRSAISSLRHEKERLRAASLTPPKFKKTEAASAGQIPRTKTQNLIKPNKSETDRDRLIVFERKGRREVMSICSVPKSSNTA